MDEKLSDEQLRKLGDMLLGTCAYAEAVVDFHEMPNCGEEDLTIQLESINIERCPYCDWWFESGELINDDSDVVGCADCRNVEEE